LLELKKSVYRLKDDDPELKPWEARLVELTHDLDPIDELLGEIEQRVMEQEDEAMSQAQGQLETLGGLLTNLAQQHHTEHQEEFAAADVIAPDGLHRVSTRDGRTFEGTWVEIVHALRDARDAGRPIDEYMALEARRHYGATGARIAFHAPEAFIRESANAGLLRIER
jgi:hypothetical protein